jgi:two-component system LytT family response regulator
VVFVTAYDKYALKAFEANALDYLTKPVKASRLAVTIDRLQSRLADASTTAQSEAAESAATRPLELRDLVLLREKTSMRMVEAGEICAVEAEADYTRIHLAGGHTVLMRKRMAQWEQELPAPPFQKISRRLLLNMPRIKSIVAHDRESADIQFEGTEKTVTVSRMELRRIRQAPD